MGELVARPSYERDIASLGPRRWKIGGRLFRVSSARNQRARGVLNTVKTRAKKQLRFGDSCASQASIP